MNSINKLGLGTVQFGISYGISNNYGQTPDIEVSSILNYAKKVGINVIDTASAYGTSENVLGKNDLSDFKVISKFIIQNNKICITEHLQKSLSNLGINSLYGYMFHRPMDVIANPKLLVELIQLKEQGLINKIGFSFNEVSEIEEIVKAGIIPDIIQVPYNYLDNRFEYYMKKLKNEGCEIHTRSAFLQGLFFCDINKLGGFFNNVKPIIVQLKEHGTKLPGMLLKYCIDRPFIDRIIIGVNTLSQLKDNINSINDINILPLNSISIDESILIPSKWPQ